jgi:AraC-like DNA-binding protein
VTLTQVSRILDTRDVDEARTAIAAGYCEHRLAVARTRNGFHAVQDEWRVGRVRLHQLRYGVDVTIDAAPLNDSVLVSSPVKGVLTVLSEGKEHRYGPGEVVAIGPDHSFGLRWEEDCELRTVQIDRSILTTHGTETGGGPSQLPSQHGASSSHASIWHTLSSLLQTQATADASTALLVNRLEGLIAAALLAYHTIPCSDGEFRWQAPRHLQEAITFIEAHADEPLTPADMASAAHMSIRALQYNLRRHTGLTPSEFLRGIRLERAYQNLVQADPAETTVAEIAHRWGFSNLGRFSRYYAERFGTLPSETLRS